MPLPTTRYVGRPSDEEEYEVPPADPAREDEQVLEVVEWHCRVAESKLRAGNLPQAIHVLRKTFREAEKSIATVSTSVSGTVGPASRLAIALIRLQLCAVLANLGRREHMLSEAEVALQDVDEVWRLLLASAENAALRRGTTQRADPLALLLRRPPVWLEAAAEAVVKARLYVALATEAVYCEEGGLEAIGAAATTTPEGAEEQLALEDGSVDEATVQRRRMEDVSEKLEGLYQEGIALANHLLPVGHSLTAHLEKAYAAMELPSSAPPEAAGLDALPSGKITNSGLGYNRHSDEQLSPEDLEWLRNVWVVDTRKWLPQVRPVEVTGLEGGFTQVSNTTSSAFVTRSQTSSNSKARSSAPSRSRRPRMTHMSSFMVPGAQRIGFGAFESWKRSVSDHQVMTPFQRALQSDEGVRYLQETLRHQSKIFRHVVLKEVLQSEPGRLSDNRCVYSKAALLTKRQVEKRLNWTRTPLVTKPEPTAKDKEKRDRLFRQYGVRCSTSEPALKHYVKLLEMASPAARERKRREAEELRSFAEGLRRDRSGTEGDLRF